MVLEKARFLRVFLFECAAANRRRFRSVLLVPLIFLMPSRPPGDRFGGDVERISTSVSVMETVSDRVAEHHEKYLDCSIQLCPARFMSRLSGAVPAEIQSLPTCREHTQEHLARSEGWSSAGGSSAQCSLAAI